MKRHLAVLALTPFLWGCPQEEKAAVVRWTAEGAVFDGDREDCLSRLDVALIEPDGERQTIWSLQSPMPIGPDVCYIRLPILYGRAPPGVSAWPDGDAPALEPGRRYAFGADGTAVHGVEFAVPAAR